jgi:hypothetical protein
MGIQLLDAALRRGAPAGILLAVVLVFLLAATASALQDGRPALSLDGPWQFRFAHDDRGDAAQWFLPAAAFDTSVPVPGCWEAAGVGEPTDKMRRHAVGVGWYRRTFEVPSDWAGRRIWLKIGGAHRSARIWINGKTAGEHWGYPTAFRFDITDLLTASGPQQIVIAVDSRRHKERDTLTGAFDLIDYMDVDWGGIFEHVELQETGSAWIDNPFVEPNPLRRSAHVRFAIAGEPAEHLTVDYSVRRWDSHPSGGRTGEEYCAGTAPADPGLLDLQLPGAPLWTPDRPRLLLLELTLRRGIEILDRRSVRFGLRRVEVRGSDFYLNGEKLFLRGYGDDWTLPIEVGSLHAPGGWQAYLRRRKEFGFNGVRHHSTMPPDSYLDAADEVGMLVQPELPIAYEQFYKEANEAGHDLYRAVWRDYILQMRNHASVFAWCMGNEQWNGIALGQELYDAAKRLDPTRPVIDTDGLWPGTDRPTCDYLPVQFEEGEIPLGAKIGKYRVPKQAGKPLIVHEMSNISVLPDPADIPKYTGAVRPFWLEQMAAAVHASGQSGRLPEMLAASRRLQASLLKLNIEAARLDPQIKGHDQWLFRDYWTQSTGFVNQMDEARDIAPAFARQFVAPAVLLWDRDDFAYRAGETLDLKLYLSDYRPISSEPIHAMSVTCDGATIRLQPPADAGGRGLIGPWTGTLHLRNSAHPESLTLHAMCPDGIHNAWPVRVFPAPTPVASHPGVTVVRRLNRRTLDALEAGARVVLMGDFALPFDTLRARFKPAWWHGDDNGDHCYGNVFAAHPALAGYPGHGFGDVEAAGMMDNRPVVLLDNVPGRPEPIIQCIDVPWRMRRKAYLFEAKVGAGRLLVCTLNFSSGLRKRDPAAAWMLADLLRYAASDECRPAASIPADWLRSRVVDSAVPDADALVEGFASLVEFGEQPQSWYSYREDSVPTYAARQTDGKQRVTWLTAPLPEGWTHDTATFAWAGGIGWETEPAGGSFQLLIDDKPALDFAFTTASATWRSADGKISLHYDVRRTVAPDSFGVFLLTVPASRLQQGKPLRLTVAATANNSKRWFSIVPYTDVAAEEKAE